MTEATLTYDQLGITPADIYEQMGYGDAQPDADVTAEVERLVDEIRTIIHPRYCFFLTKGELAPRTCLLEACGRRFMLGRIIAHQLRGASAFAFFVATAGMEFEQFQHRLKEEGDMVRVFIADAIGSVIAEKTADRMEEALQRQIDTAGWKHTNRFSPGYCGWHVSAQQDLFKLFPSEAPCGVSLTDSSLMLPIKSVSGIIGIGSDVRKLPYSCGICGYQNCYKRRAPSSSTSRRR